MTATSSAAVRRDLASPGVGAAVSAPEGGPILILGAVAGPHGSDPQRPEAAVARRAFLAKVDVILRTLPVDVDVRYGDLETSPDGAHRWGPPAGVPGLVVRTPRGLRSVNAVAQVVAATVVDERDSFDALGSRLVREQSLDFEPFPGRGRAVYRLYILEDAWEARGHSRWSPPARVLQSEDPAEVAMAVAAWAGRPGQGAPRPPVPASRTAQLRRQLEARRAALATVEVVADLAPRELVEAAGEPVLDLVDRRLLVWHFPRGQRGSLQTRAVVALTCCRRGDRPQARELWLCAEGPASPRVPQRIRLSLRWEHGVNQDHRWDGARYLWHSRSQQAGLEVCWGIDDRARADRSAELLEAGRLREGMDLYGVRLSPATHEVALGWMPWYELRHLAGMWSAEMQAQLSGAAPWLLSAAARKGPGAKGPVRLFGLGGQSIARKPGVFLAGGPGRAAAGDPLERGHRTPAPRAVAASGRLRATAARPSRRERAAFDRTRHAVTGARPFAT